MFHNGIEDWLGVITIITMLSGWCNYLVIKPLKDMMQQQSEGISKIEKNFEVYKTDLHRLRERVAVLEHDIATIKQYLEKVEQKVDHD